MHRLSPANLLSLHGYSYTTAHTHAKMLELLIIKALSPNK